MNFVRNLFRNVKEVASPVIAVIPPGMTRDFVGLLGQEMYSCVGGHHYPNAAAFVGIVGVIRHSDWLKEKIMKTNLWKFMNKRNVSPFKRVNELPYRFPGMPPHILERWGRLVWDTEDIYGNERDEGGNVILPTAPKKSILKKGEMESPGGGSQSNMRGIKRVDFCVKEGHPRDQQPPVPRPTIEERRARWIEEEEEEWEWEEIERLLMEEEEKKKEKEGKGGN